MPIAQPVYRPATQQPKGQVTPHPLATHWQCGDRSKVFPVTVVTNLSTVRANAYGVGRFSVNNTESSARYGLVGTDGDNDLTAMVCFVPHTTVAANTGIFGSWSSTGVTRYTQFIHGAGVLRLQCARSSAVGSDYTTSATGYPFVLGLRTRAGGDIEYWVNGALYSTLTGLGTGACGQSTASWQTNNYYDASNTRASSTLVLGSIAIPRYFSADEMTMYGKNFWRLFG